MYMANEQEFILELLHQYWGTNNDMPHAPNSWIIRDLAGGDSLPVIAVVLMPSEFTQHGFSGRYLSYKKELGIIVYLPMDKAYLKSEWEDEIVRIMKTYCKVPTTTNFPTAIIDYIHVKRAYDDDSMYTDHALAVRRIDIVCDIQRNLN